MRTDFIELFTYTTLFRSINGLMDWWIVGLLESESSGIWLGSGSRIWVSVFMRVKMGVGFSRIYSDIVGGRGRTELEFSHRWTQMRTDFEQKKTEATGWAT